MRILLIAVLLIVPAIGSLAGEIHDAARSGDLETVQKLCKSNPDVLGERDAGGYTPLHAAAYQGQLDVVSWLLDQGADVNAASRSGSTPLHGAGFYGHPEMVLYLLDHGADPEKLNNFGYTPMFSAAAGHQWEAASILLDRGSSLMALSSEGYTIGHFAAADGKVDWLDRWLAAGGDLNQRTNEGQNLLYYAAAGGHLDLVERMLAEGADPGIADQAHQSPLWGAIDGEEPEMVQFLLDAGIGPNLGENLASTPLAWAVIKGNPEVVRMLLAHGAEVNTRNPDGFPMLFDMSQGDRNLEILSLLVDAGARIEDTEPFHGMNALHAAALEGNAPLVEMYASHTRDIDARTAEDATALQLAATHGHRDVVEILKAHGADTADLPELSGGPAELGKDVPTGAAHLWYLGHCGWAIKTASHLLIFDYFNQGFQPEHPSLANGHLNCSELADQDVIVFVSHDHADHYCRDIFEMADKIKSVQFVYGWEATANPIDMANRRPGGPYDGPEFTFIPAHQTGKVGEAKVTPIVSNDGGQAFVVQVDGLTIYHSGDHAGWREGEEAQYKDEINFIAENCGDIDIAFQNVTGCRFRDRCPLDESNAYALDMLHPAVWVPTHGVQREFAYQQAADRMKERGIMMPTFCPCAKGDHFFYERIDRAMGPLPVEGRTLCAGALR